MTSQTARGSEVDMNGSVVQVDIFGSVSAAFDHACPKTVTECVRREAGRGGRVVHKKREKESKD